MCFGCSLWYPLNELGYKVLGLDPSLPLWVNSNVDSDLYDVYTEIRDNLPAGTLGYGIAYGSGGKFTTKITRAWLQDRADKTRGAYHKSKLDETSDYKKILFNEVKPGASDCYLFTLHYMIHVSHDLGAELRQSNNLPEHSTLWGGPGHENMSTVRIGRISLPRVVVYERYRNSPELAKFIDFTD